jgi:glycerate dehydrogenase
MKIVVLDGYTLNPGDLSWDSLSALGECDIHERTVPAQVVERTLSAEIAITNKVILDRAIQAQLPKLRYIGVTATGYNIVDVAAARERGIVVTNVPTYGTRSVAQMTFALILELALHVGHHAQTVRDGRWCKSENFCYWDHPLVELEGLTLGLIGFGRIGQATAQAGQGFGMRVIAHDAMVKNSPIPGVTLTDLDTVFRESDVVSLHCPLTADNKGLVNAQHLAMMKPTAFLINTARGPLVDDDALASSLNSGKIAGAGLDVLSVEPPRPDNPLLKARNCLVTPHISWATRAARQRLMDVTVDNVRAFLKGSPQNVVS